MKISLCNEVVRGLDFPAQCALAKALGYDGLEIAPFTLGHQPHRLVGVRRTQLRRIAVDHGLEITGLHWLLLAPEGLSITSRDDGTRERDPRRHAPADRAVRRSRRRQSWSTARPSSARSSRATAGSRRSRALKTPSRRSPTTPSRRASPIASSRSRRARRR